MFGFQNILIIFGIAVAKFMYGWLWYGVLFQKQWLAAMNESKRQIPKDAVTAMTMNFVGTIISSSVFFHLIDKLDITSVLGGAFLGLLLWFGFVVATNVDALAFEGQSKKLFILNNAYHMTSLMLMGALYGFFY